MQDRTGAPRESQYIQIYLFLYISLCVAVSWLCSAVVCGAEDSDPELLANIARLSRIEFANPDIDSKYAIFGEAAAVLALKNGVKIEA